MKVLIPELLELVDDVWTIWAAAAREVVETMLRKVPARSAIESVEETGDLKAVVQHVVRRRGQSGGSAPSSARREVRKGGRGFATETQRHRDSLERDL